MKNCHLRLRRHTWYWTGNGYQSFWGGWRNEKRCQDCGTRLYVPGVRGSLPTHLQGDIEVGGVPPIDITEHVGGAPMFPAPKMDHGLRVGAPPRRPDAAWTAQPTWQGQPRGCPFCGEVVYSTGEEVQHMERQHPEIIAERLRGF